MEQLRTRTDDAIRDAQLLPAWFTIVLGAHPPARDTEAWLRTAVDIVAYRMTYHVTDPTVALGREPSHEQPHRQSWYYTLGDQIRRYGR